MNQINLIKEVRNVTGLGLIEARNYLIKNNWDLDNTLKTISNDLGVIVDRWSHKETHEGIVDCYIHIGSKLGVIVEVNCETDFVARCESMKKFAREICLQVAASSPVYVSKEDIPFDVIAKLKYQYNEEAEKRNLPFSAAAKYVGGMLDRYYSSNCLLEQVYIKQNDKLIKDLLNELISNTKETIRIRRFTKYTIGT